MKQFIKSEGGATALEYSLIAGVIALAIATGAHAVGTNINNTFHCVADMPSLNLPDSNGPSCL